VVHPFDNRKLPIVLDNVLVDMKFGTGAVKITPAHDPNDYICGKKHNLPFINLLNDDGTINKNGGIFQVLPIAAVIQGHEGADIKCLQGMKRFDARNAVINALKEKGLYRGNDMTYDMHTYIIPGRRDNAMSIGTCSRSKDIIEPLLKPQWWVNCKSMAEKAVKAVKDGELEIIPPHHKETWYRWLENIRDWCISRQLWWGHRCPAYLVTHADLPDPDVIMCWL
jgi:valyl-tRNA synthetase